MTDHIHDRAISWIAKRARLLLKGLRLYMEIYEKGHIDSDQMANRLQKVIERRKKLLFRRMAPVYGVPFRVYYRQFDLLNRSAIRAKDAKGDEFWEGTSWLTTVHARNAGVHARRMQNLLVRAGGDYPDAFNEALWQLHRSFEDIATGNDRGRYDTAGLANAVNGAVETADNILQTHFPAYMESTFFQWFSLFYNIDYHLRWSRKELLDVLTTKGTIIKHMKDIERSIQKLIAHCENLLR